MSTVTFHRACAGLLAYMLPACSPEAPADPTPLAPLSDGMAPLDFDARYCENDIDDSGYGLCGGINLYLPALTGRFIGVYYANGTAYEPEDLAYIPSSHTFQRIEGSPDEAPAYRMAFDGWLDGHPSRVAGSGTVSFPEDEPGIQEVTGTLWIEFYGHALEIPIDPSTEGAGMQVTVDRSAYTGYDQAAD